jgi:hypothetical protein
MIGLRSIVTHQRTAIATIAVAVLLALADGLRQGRVVWSTIGYVALTALAGVAKSALGAQGGAGDTINEE